MVATKVQAMNNSYIYIIIQNWTMKIRLKARATMNLLEKIWMKKIEIVFKCKSKFLIIFITLLTCEICKENIYQKENQINRQLGIGAVDMVS